MGFFGTQKDKIQAFLDKLTNDAHIPIAIFVFSVTMFYVWHTGKDLPPGFVSSLYAFYGFLGGHALVYQKWPDAAAQPPTQVNVDVQNNNDNSNTNTANASANAVPAPDPGTGSSNAKG
jgi:hypothetical protein